LACLSIWPRLILESQVTQRLLAFAIATEDRHVRKVVTLTPIMLATLTGIACLVLDMNEWIRVRIHVLAVDHDRLSC
jgi:hypothetical protein